jgi:hypothetical protein
MQSAASFHPSELWMFFAKDAAFRVARVKPHPLQFSYDGFLTVILEKLENCLYSRFESLSTIVFSVLYAFTNNQIQTGKTL